GADRLVRVAARRRLLPRGPPAVARGGRADPPGEPRSEEPRRLLPALLRPAWRPADRPSLYLRRCDRRVEPHPALRLERLLDRTPRIDGAPRSSGRHPRERLAPRLGDLSVRAPARPGKREQDRRRAFLDRYPRGRRRNGARRGSGLPGGEGGR